MPRFSGLPHLQLGQNKWEFDSMPMALFQRKLGNPFAVGRTVDTFLLNASFFCDLYNCQ